MAIKRKPLSLHLEIQRYRGNPIGLIRSSFRENGKVKHSTHGRITGLTLEQLKLVQAAFRRSAVPATVGKAAPFQICDMRIGYTRVSTKTTIRACGGSRCSDSH